MKLSGTCPFIASAVVAFSLFCGRAHAVTIVIPAEAFDSNRDIQDPGWAFSELNGTALAGQLLSIDFVFAQPLLVHDLDLDNGVNELFAFMPDLFHDSALTFQTVQQPSGFLFDENGPLPPLVIIRSAAGNRPGVVLYGLDFGPDELLNGVLISGVHFELRLPDAGGAAHITGADLEIVNPSGRVPKIAEPGTLALLGLGLLGLGATRRSF